LTLTAVVQHCRANPPNPADIAAIQKDLLGYFCSLSTIETGDLNTDAEMRVYCAYSYPAVVLLFGASHWQGPLRDCFLTLVNPPSKDDQPVTPPLPVKRCLASSIHTVAHVLGGDLTVKDVLPVFRQHFLLDTDDSVRLNVIRNFPWLISLLPPDLRNEYLSLWKDIVKGEDLLGAHKRSATNPMLLNWRQRDYVSRSLPELLGLVSPTQVQKQLWPVIQMLLVDSVSLVREDAEWSIPLILRTFCSDTVLNSGSDAKRWSATVCQEVVSWLKDTFLSNGSSTFAKRQLYCRICAAAGLALRFGDLDPEDQWDHRYRPLLTSPSKGYVAYQSMSMSERKNLRRLLVYDLLPPTLEMKDDRVTNVRLTLMKMLQEMPDDIKSLPNVAEVLKELEDEVETWESFNSGLDVRSPPPPPPPSQQLAAV
jgi:serine/threonine-protein phosphatase 4 regulatory subunit 1